MVWLTRVIYTQNMIKFHSLISAMIILMSCNDPEIKDKNIIMENKDSTIYSSHFTAIEKGKAPGMKYRLLAEHDGIKEFTLIFADHSAGNAVHPTTVFAFLPIGSVFFLEANIDLPSMSNYFFQNEPACM
jgi:hypothetical protein